MFWDWLIGLRIDTCILHPIYCFLVNIQWLIKMFFLQIRSFHFCQIPVSFMPMLTMPKSRLSSIYSIFSINIEPAACINFLITIYLIIFNVAHIKPVRIPIPQQFTSIHFPQRLISLKWMVPFLLSLPNISIFTAGSLFHLCNQLIYIK